jgi:hypothetical protein
MNTKIIASLAIIAVVGVGVIGATRAYFSDSATISGTTFSAGTMNIQVDKDPRGSAQVWSDGFDLSSDDYKNWINTTIGTGAYDTLISQMALTNLKPGDTKEQIIDIKNVGSLDGNATIDLNRTSEWSNLAGKMTFKVTYDDDADGVFDDGTYGVTGLNGTVDQFVSIPYVLGSLASNGVASVKIVWSVPTDAENEIMGDSVTVNTVFGLEQIH